MNFLLPALTGLLLIASFPRAGQGYLAWVAFLPLAVFLSRTVRIKQAFAGGFISGFVQFFALMIWMPPVLMRYGGLSPFLAWISYTLLGTVLACYPAAACAVAQCIIRKRGSPYILLFPCIWVLFEYAQSLSPFGGLPWLLAGYTQSGYLETIQIADITGVYGISFLLVWTGTACAWFIERRRGFRALLPALVAVTLIAVCLAYGAVSVRDFSNVVPRFHAAMLQGNISYDDPAPTLQDKFRNGYVRMADRLGPQNPDLLILPESPSPIFFESDPGYRNTVEQLAKRFSMGLVFNDISSRETRDGLRYFNSAFFLDRNGALAGVYDKIHLVPFGEYIPLESLFSFVEVITKDVGAFESGKEPRIVRIGGRPANAIICFEAVFPGLVRLFVRQGSELIINLTNDGWYGNSAAPYQHLGIARFRAVENRRYLLRATNSGISAIIEPTGRIQAATGLLGEAICEGHFDFISAATFYSRYGDVFVFLCAIISCGLALLPGLHRVMVDKRSGQEE
jgi:apolipoprotein N-acyltransferase